jgi:hypothetical protein
MRDNVIYLSLNSPKLISTLITREYIRLTIQRVPLQNLFAGFILRINIIGALILNINWARGIPEAFQVWKYLSFIWNALSLDLCSALSTEVKIYASPFIVFRILSFNFATDVLCDVKITRSAKISGVSRAMIITPEENNVI